METDNKKQIWVSELIGEAYKNWINEKVILDCGTGHGKTSFILKQLAPYAFQSNKKILYLCNRKKLLNQIQASVESTAFIEIDVMLYQVLQDKIVQGEEIPFYDYIVADEIHYLISDALFNDFTDISYKYLINQANNVVIFMSATAKSLFNMLQNKGYVDKRNYYHIDKNYDYVENVYFYKSKQLTSIIDDILENKPQEKIIVFCNSVDRLYSMYKLYSEHSYFLCSQNVKNKKVLDICTNDCIKYIDDKYITFDKRILFTTKVLDNGVDIKDESVKHIFTEIFDLDSAIQSLGRKRSLNPAYDKCNFYIKEYEPRAINMFLGQNEAQLNPIRLYKKDREQFILWLKESKSMRNFTKRNNIIYTDWENTESEKINQIRYVKYFLDNVNINKMIEDGYNCVMCEWLGDSLTQKVKPLDIECKENDLFREYLISILNKKLFEDERLVLKDKFRDIGLKDRTMGINTLNGKLKDSNYNYKLVSKKETQRTSENRNKMYWVLTQVN